MKKRIWELDVFRGICILGMVLVHFVYDLVDMYGLISWNYEGTLFSYVKDWGGLLFILLSGICVTLGNNHVKRGLIVYGCGMLVGFVTVIMYLLGFAGRSIIIYFGALHCLGACMILWALFRKCPDWVLIPVGILLIGIGIYLRNHSLTDISWLILGEKAAPDFYTSDYFRLLLGLGVTYPGFSSSDYFPLLFNLGFFLLGAVVGRHRYATKETLFPKVNDQNIVIRILSFCGRQSLWIYMGHQPILSGICELIVLLK